MANKKIAVIGGGAAGMMAAITAAREGSHVTILEQNDRLGKKILATGNGKCNLGNLELSPDAYFCNAKEILKNCLERFNQHDTIDFFNGIGLLIKNKGEYLYPACEQASAVLDVLRTELKVSGITVITEARVDYIAGKGQLDIPDKIEVGWMQKRMLFDKVIITCGSKAAPKTGSDGSGYKLARLIGHNITPIVPALVQLRCREEYCKSLGGIRTEAAVTIWKGTQMLARERGEVQLTEYGISGIPVFQLSRVVNYSLRESQELVAELDFMPYITREEFNRIQESRQRLFSGRTVEEFFTGMLPKKLMMLFIKMAGMKPSSYIKEVSTRQIQSVYEKCQSFRLHITGSNSFDNAQICAGGVAMEEITEKMESKKLPGVYFAGELLDVDGRCGGYNLQWAWSSGFVAGKSASEQ